MEKTIRHSIFNDVLGPIMAGPSSSHSGGCARIGLTIRNLFGKDIKKAMVVFDAAGSYPATYIGQGSDFGFTGGLMGMKTDDPRIKNAVEIAKEDGRDIRFSREMLSHVHPNEARIDVYGKSGVVEMSALTLSTGGGTFEIIKLDEFPVFIDGSCRLSFIKCTEQAAERITNTIKVLFPYAEITCTATADISDISEASNRLLTVKQLSAEDEHKLDELSRDANVLSVRHSGQVLPVSTCTNNLSDVFHNAKGALSYAQVHGLDAGDLAVVYECGIGELNRSEVLGLAKHTYDVMRFAASTPPDPKTEKQFGFLPYQCKNMIKNAESKAYPIAPVGCLDRALFYAVSVMENSCAHNTIAAAPTAGSSGVMPAAVLSVAETMDLTEETALKGLLAGGLVGAFIANHATFGAEVAGCQAENGAASAMAAAAVVCMLGGNAEQSFQAASMALQNLLGLICDPVGGLTEIPCISRNVSAVSNAVMAANMVLLGFDPKIPLDETISCMLRVGKALPESLRCTCRGGLCTTPTGQCLGCHL